MDWNNLGEEKQAEIVVKALIELAYSDDKLTMEELGYIVEVGTKLGLNEHSIEELLKRAVDDVNFTVPLTERDRMSIMYYLLFLMKVDHSISQDEERLIYKFGFKLGFRETMVKDFITVIKEHHNRTVPPEEMINILTKYLN